MVSANTRDHHQSPGPAAHLGAGTLPALSLPPAPSPALGMAQYRTGPTYLKRRCVSFVVPVSHLLSAHLGVRGALQVSCEEAARRSERSRTGLDVGTWESGQGP